MAARFSTSDLGRTLRDTASPSFALDDLGRLIFANSALVELLHLSEADLLGKHVQFSSGGATPLEELINRLGPPPEVFAGQSMNSFVFFAHEAESQLKTFRIHWVPLQSETSDAAAVIGVLYPIENNVSEQSAFNDDLRTQSWHEQLMNYRATAKNQFRLTDLVGSSSIARIAQQQAFQASKSSTSLLITGPTGIGKKTLARSIHYAGSKSDERLLELDCSALSSFQSIERFNSAITTVASKLKTILIANIDSLSSEAQLLIYNALRKQPSWRVIATSSVEASELLTNRVANQDLLMILSATTISLPGLAERSSDIPFYVQSIIEQENLRGGRTMRGCSRDAFERIASYSWPGQLTELRAALIEAREKCAGHEITAADLPGYLAQAELKSMYPAPAITEPIDLEKTLAKVERELLTRALNSAKGNKTAAAQIVGMSRPRFYRRLVELGLAEEESAKKPSSPATSPNAKSSSKSKARDAARKRKNRKPTPFDDMPSEVLSTSPDDPDFIDDIPFIPTDESHEDED